jgi:FG-GAP-like repeat
MRKRGRRRWIAAGLVASACAFAILTGEAADPAAPPPPVYGPAGNPVWFEPHRTYEGHGDFVGTVAIADVTGDRRNDVVMTAGLREDYRLLVYPQRAGGSLAPARSHRLDSRQASDVDVGDMNRDGRTDVAVVSARGIDVLYGRAAGLARPANVLEWPGSSRVLIRDMNRDGTGDLIVGASAVDGKKTGVFVLTKSRGGFSARRVHPYVLQEVEIGDVNGDGRPDLVGLGLRDSHAFTGANLLMRCLQSRGGAFRCSNVALELGPHGGGPNGLEVADVTGDRRADIVITAGGNHPSGRLIVYRQTPGGKLAAPVPYSATDLPRAVEAGDVNGDGRLDVVVAHTGFPYTGVFIQKPDGKLGSEELHKDIYGTETVRGLAVGDVTGDGRTDVASAGDGDLYVVRHANGGTGGLSVFYVDLLSRPRVPQAGRRYELRLVVARRYRALKDRSRLRAGCLAEIEGGRLPVLARFSEGNSVVCRWNVPASARGKVLTSRISAGWRAEAALEFPYGGTVG